MPRTARFINPDGGAYHVICRGNNKANVFHERADFTAYRDILAQCKKEKSFRLYHYVFMTNHVHFVLEPTVPLDFSMIMKQINQRYSIIYQKHHDYVGHLWQQRFKSIPIMTDAHFLTCGIYIELNPVRAGMIEEPEFYPWSSYKTYAFGEKDDLVDEDPFYKTFGSSLTERQTIYRAMTKMWQYHPVNGKSAKKLFS